MRFLIPGRLLVPGRAWRFPGRGNPPRRQKCGVGKAREKLKPLSLRSAAV
jgi:hypothetical protein